MSEEKGIVAKLTGAISDAGGAVKTTLNTIAGIQKLHIDYSVKEKTFELVTKLMEIQSLLISAKDRIIELEYEKKQKDNWELESAKYELFKTEGGSLLYRIKSSEQCDQSEIYLCPHCYEERKKSILQPSPGETIAGYHQSFCPSCKNKYTMNEDKDRFIQHIDNTEYDPFKNM